MSETSSKRRDYLARVDVALDDHSLIGESRREKRKKGPWMREREGEDKSTECTQYYERRQHLAPITGPAAKPRVQKPKKSQEKRPFFPVISVICVFLAPVNT
jgi:hypothetical protein